MDAELVYLCRKEHAECSNMVIEACINVYKWFWKFHSGSLTGSSLNDKRTYLN